MPAALFAFLPLASCGEIVLGQDIPGGGDGGRAQTLSDAGDRAPDAGPGADAAGPGGCRTRTAPPFPLTWPFGNTKAAYKAEFYDPLPGGSASCALSACHGARTPIGNAPLIPAIESDLDAPATLADVIEQLYARVKPGVVVGAPGPVSPLLYHHSPTGGNGAPPFTAAQVAFVQRLIERAQNCGFVAIKAMETAAGGPSCTAGVCDCPITLDLGYCVP